MFWRRMPKEAAQLAALVKKLSVIQGEIGKVAPDGYNKHSKYSFISHHKMSEIMSRLLPQYGIFVVKNCNDLASNEAGKNSNGTMVYKAVARFMFDIYDVDTGFKLSIPFSGYAHDYGGKDGAQAITETIKRFYFKQFDVAENVPDADGDTPTVTKPATQPRQQQRPAPPQQQRQAAQKTDQASKLAADLKTGADKGAFSQMPQELQKAALRAKLSAEHTEGLYRALRYSTKRTGAVIEVYTTLAANDVPDISLKEIVRKWKECNWNDRSGKVTNWVQAEMDKAAQGKAGEEDQTK